MSDAAPITHADRSAGLSHVDRSAPISHSVADQVGIDPDAQEYVDRVENDGGTVHDQFWVDTVISKLKDLGWYADTLLIVGGEMGTDVASTGSDVGIWYDASGNRYDATQTDSARKATLDTDSSLDGTKVLNFDDTDDWYETPAFSSVQSQPVTHITVARVTTADADSMYDGLDTADRHLLRYFGSTDQEVGLNTNAGLSTPSSFSADSHVFVAVADGTSSVIRVDGTQEVQGDAGTADLGGVRFGLRADDVQPFGGTYATEIKIAARVPDADIAEIEKMLNDRKAAY